MTRCATCGHDDDADERHGAEWFAAFRAFAWLPITVAVFFVGWQNVVAVTFLYSAYANFESGIAAWQGAKAARRAKN